MPLLPTDHDIQEAETRKRDRFYKLPLYVETFIERANNEVPKPYWVAPWTINRAVTLFNGANFPVAVVSYDSIDQDIVATLDHIVAIAKGENHG